MEARKVVFVKEIVRAEAGGAAAKPISRVAAIAVIANPFAGKLVEDLSPLFDIGMQLGEELMPKAVALLDGKPVSYGKAAIVGVNGDLEHAPAVLHPKLGKPMRQAVGGGEAIIPSNTKVAAAGATLDVPLANKDNIWSFDELDTMTARWRTRRDRMRSSSSWPSPTAAARARVWAKGAGRPSAWDQCCAAFDKLRLRTDFSAIAGLPHAALVEARMALDAVD
jgi:amino acid synthesis protein